jgi:hypothetical protein
MATPEQTLCELLPVVSAIACIGLTVIVPLRDTGEQPPVPDVVTVYGNDPDTDGVPLMVKVEPENTPDMPVGRAPAVILADVAPPLIVYTVLVPSVVF